jgi:hypothetical protein|tara:strand:+ start:317 stop:619 length:303 start_codon:yes stop_codon:yes gene_type:complete
LVDGGQNGSDPQVDIHLDLDLIKNADDFETQLDNKSLLALCLVLLKQVQPYVADFESHEEAYNQTISNYEAAQKRSMLMNMQEDSQAQIQDQAPERSQDR